MLKFHHVAGFPRSHLAQPEKNTYAYILRAYELKIWAKFRLQS